MDIETLQEITEEIQNNPEWRDELKKLGIAFREAYLKDEFTDAMTDLVSRRFKIENKKILPTVVTILILLYAIWSALEGGVENNTHK